MKKRVRSGAETDQNHGVGSRHRRAGFRRARRRHRRRRESFFRCGFLFRQFLLPVPYVLQSCAWARRGGKVCFRFRQVGVWGGRWRPASGKRGLIIRLHWFRVLRGTGVVITVLREELVSFEKVFQKGRYALGGELRGFSEGGHQKKHDGDERSDTTPFELGQNNDCVQAAYFMFQQCCSSLKGVLFYRQGDVVIARTDWVPLAAIHSNFPLTESSTKSTTTAHRRPNEHKTPA